MIESGHFLCPRLLLITHGFNLARLTMTTWNEFLVGNAKFPFPPDESQSVDFTRVSAIEAGCIDPSWKAQHAVRDEHLVRKLCDTLRVILADDIFSENDRAPLLNCFSPILPTLMEEDWLENENEAKVHMFSNHSCEHFRLTLK
jgi:hypothetical protein